MLQDEIQKREAELLLPAVRHSRAALDRLLSDDFVEFGASGRIFTKLETVALLLAEPPNLELPAATNFRVTILGPDAVLATYRCGNSLRSSVWRREGAEWRIVFHQGTRSA
ncbi:MAG TPA: DUF4440 domain-containing protein [Polyangiaceae bacterium]|nr:DUF4440 domain-containing protein [Polyangiaceae bacterium]